MYLGTHVGGFEALSTKKITYLKEDLLSWHKIVREALWAIAYDERSRDPAEIWKMIQNAAVGVLDP